MPRVIPRSVTSPGLHMPINHFIRSLAQECGSRAMGIILSGAGTDGAAGLDAMRGAGGVTFAQNPATEKIRQHATRRTLRYRLASGSVLVRLGLIAPRCRAGLRAALAVPALGRPILRSLSAEPGRGSDSAQGGQ